MSQHRTLSQFIDSHNVRAESIDGELELMRAERAELARVIDDFKTAVDDFGRQIVARFDKGIARAEALKAEHGGPITMGR